ncbi:hypothetical protein A9G29_12365 [Gilliamella sp. Fer2-1]|nr:hypothetical protein A9G29_12365 [Gilliamella apicola]
MSSLLLPFIPDASSENYWYVLVDCALLKGFYLSLSQICHYQIEKSHTILDATIRPYEGNKSLLQYTEAVIDISANQIHNAPFPESLTSKPLTVDIIDKACKGECKNLNIAMATLVQE